MDYDYMIVSMYECKDIQFDFSNIHNLYIHSYNLYQNQLDNTQCDTLSNRDEIARFIISDYDHNMSMF